MGKSNLSDPNMSDRLLLISVEDLINMALGPINKNIVNYKLIQTILHIFARQMRLLEQRVEIYLSDEGETTTAARDEHIGKQTKHTSSKSPRKGKDRTLSKDRSKLEIDADKDETGRSDGGAKDENIGSKSYKKTKTKKEREKDEEDRDGEKDKLEGEAAKYKDKQRDKQKDKHKDMQKDVQKEDKIEKAGSRGKSKSKLKEEAQKQSSNTSIVASGSREKIEVVTRSQFELVEKAVRKLQNCAVPPLPTLPDNATLRADLASGSATLGQTMEAMQVQARVHAAEQAIERLGGLLGELAAAGALPPALQARAQGLLAHLGRGAAGQHAELGAQDIRVLKTGSESKSAPGSTWAASSAVSDSSLVSLVTIGNVGVTHSQMEDALCILREELTKNIQNMTNRSAVAADHANMAVTNVSDKLNIALQLELRINTLNNLVAEYEQQLSGIDGGVYSQMQSFNDQLREIQADLQSGMKQLKQSNSNAETAMVLELRERCEGLASHLNSVLHTHTELAFRQHNLSLELRALMEAVEMLREQKADRDEVQDALRDKADLSRLAGLLSAAELAAVRERLDRCIEACHEKFHQQDNVWMVRLTFYDKGITLIRI
ncbi:hypothetical protein ACJJTC_016393 [Scirpophaga incertulas]